MFVRFLFVFDFNLFRIVLWPSVGKELSPWLFTCPVFVFINAILIPFWCLGQDVEFDCIDSWPLPFYLLCMYIFSKQSFWKQCLPNNKLNCWQISVKRCYYTPESRSWNSKRTTTTTALSTRKYRPPSHTSPYFTVRPVSSFYRPGK